MAGSSRAGAGCLLSWGGSRGAGAGCLLSGVAFEGYMTAPLAYNATAAQVETALEAMSSVDNVSVTGNSGGPWTITFGGTQSGENVARLDGDISAATAGTLERTISYAYDANGQLTSASDPDSSYAITYDHLGRVTQVDNNGTSGVPRVVLDSVYDAAGNRASLAATVAGTADFLNEYTHDALHRLTRLDQVGQTGGNSVAEKRVDLAYNAINEFTSIARYQDTDGGSTHEVATSAYSYDDLGRLTDLAYTQGGNNLFTAYSWSYDDLSSAGMGADGVADPRVAATAVLVVPAGLGRVTEMTSQDGTSTYSYDAKSELTAATHTFQSNGGWHWLSEPREHSPLANDLPASGASVGLRRVSSRRSVHGSCPVRGEFGPVYRVTVPMVCPHGLDERPQTSVWPPANGMVDACSHWLRSPDEQLQVADLLLLAQPVPPDRAGIARACDRPATRRGPRVECTSSCASPTASIRRTAKAPARMPAHRGPCTLPAASASAGAWCP